MRFIKNDASVRSVMFCFFISEPKDKMLVLKIAILTPECFLGIKFDWAIDCLNATYILCFG